MTPRHDTTDNVTAAVVLITLTKAEVWTALRDTDSGDAQLQLTLLYTLPSEESFFSVCPQCQEDQEDSCIVSQSDLQFIL